MKRLALGYFLGWQAAAFSLGAAAIHFSEISPHIEEYWLFGAFFFVISWFQAASAVGVVASPNRRLALVTAAVNLVVIAIWIWSRTAGLPIGPDAGEPERVGAADLLSSILEALVVAWTIGLLFHQVASLRAPRRLGILMTMIVWTGVVAATSLVFFTETGGAMGH